MNEDYQDQTASDAATHADEVPAGIAAARASWEQSAQHWRYAWYFLPVVAAAAIGIGVLFGEAPAITIAIISGVLIVIIFIAYLDWRSHRARAYKLMEVSQIMGFTYEGQAEKKAIDGRFGVFTLLNGGHSHRILNILEGDIGDWHVVIMEWRYTVGSGKNARHHAHTQVIIPDVDGLPVFQLSPESIFHKMAQFFGMADINFEDSPKFSKSYLLRGSNEAAIRAVFTPEVRAFIEQERNWNVESRDGYLLVFRSDTVLEPDKCPEFAAEALRLAAMLHPAETSGQPEEFPPG